MKKFVRLCQEYYVDTIIDVDENDSEEVAKKKILEKVDSHIKNNPDTPLINQGGTITCMIDNDRIPTDEDEETYECID